MNHREPSGLSSKERSYIICHFQSRTKQYENLKFLASNAIQLNQIFTIYGGNSCNPIRQALCERGWVEKLPPNRMNLLKISSGKITNIFEIETELGRLLLSSLVDKYNSSFIWRTKDKINNNRTNQEGNATCNKLTLNSLWTTKAGLSSIIDIRYWNYIENVSEVVGPRTYINNDLGEVEEFIKDYKISACTNLLKWLLLMDAQNQTIFAETGKVSMNVITFALNRCKEYLSIKQHEDIDYVQPSPTIRHWNAFLTKSSKIIDKIEVFKTDKVTKLQFYLSYGKLLLNHIYKYRPQLNCEGVYNVWIIKPPYCSRGRGITLASSLHVIKKIIDKPSNKFVIQKYIGELYLYVSSFVFS